MRRANVRAQVFAIIDDIAVELRKPSMVEHYQLKNVHHLSWSSVAKDFIRQKELCDKTKIKSRLYLVVPTQALGSKLKNMARAKLSKCAIVTVFPYIGIPLLVQTHKPFRDALIKLSPFAYNNAENDKLLSLATFLCGYWLMADNEISINDLAVGMEAGTGAFCRPMKGNRRIPSDVRRLLSTIPNFEWTLHKGFLFWSYGRADSGRYPHHCWTQEFDRLLWRIRRNRPTSFDDIESELK